MGLSDARYIRYTADTRYVGKVGNRNIKENRLKVLKDTFAEEFSNSEMNIILPAKLETVINPITISSMTLVIGIESSSPIGELVR